MEKYILKIDDEQAVLKLLERILSKNGYKSVSCNSSVKCTAIIRSPL